MKVALEQHADRWLLRLEGEITLACAAEVKKLLLQWMAEGISARQTLELDMGSAEAIDITILQLIWSAAREGARADLRIAGRASGAVAAAMREAGFYGISSFPFRDESLS